MQTRQAITHQDALNLADWLTGLPVPFTLTMKEGKTRTLDQNSLVHKWFGEIARHFGDRDYLDVKAQCHVDYGVSIRCRDPLFEWIWRETLSKMPYEKQVAFFRKQYRKVEGKEQKPVLYMTSIMSVPELTEYMNAMARDYRAQGVRLTDPEDKNV